MLTLNDAQETAVLHQQHPGRRVIDSKARAVDEALVLRTGNAGNASS